MITSSVNDCYGMKRRKLKPEKIANRMVQHKSSSELEI